VPADHAPPVADTPAPLPPPPPLAAKATDLEALRSAVVDAATVGAGLWLSYLFVLFYLLVAAGSVTHRDLLLQSPIKLPFLSVDLPLVGFFVLGPAIFLVVHAYVLLHFVLLAIKVIAFDGELGAQIDDADVRARLRRQLPSNIFVQYLAGPREVRHGEIGWLLRAIALTTLVFAPIALLGFFALQFLPYHDAAVTWWQRIAVLIDLALLWTLWPQIAGRRTAPPGGIGRRIFTYGGGVLASACVLLLVFVVGTTAAERLNRLNSAPPLDAVYSALIAGDVDFASQKPTSLWSNRLVLPGFNAGTGAEPPRLSLRGRNLEGAVLIGADLRHADLTAAQLANARLDDADLREVSFGCATDASAAGAHCASLSGASFVRARLDHAALSGADLQGADLSEALADSADLSRARLSNATLFRGSLRSANLDGAVLSGAVLDNTNLAGASLDGADLRYASLAAANLAGARAHSDFSGARLDGAHLEGATLRGARLHAASLYGAHMTFTSLDDAELLGASLQQTELGGASLQRAIVWRADPRTARVRDIRATSVVTEPKTLWRAGGAHQLSLQPWTKAAADQLREQFSLSLSGNVEDTLARVARTDPDAAFSAEADIVAAWTRIVADAAVEPINANDLIGRMKDIACAPADAPHVVAGIAERLVDMKQSGDPAMVPLAIALARAFLDTSRCPGAAGLPPAAQHVLETIVAAQ
jgi:uncharacterized protein YjbI with pentapeptide repeats